jgi:NitT/TauT family transport system substrate-binding protein
LIALALLAAPASRRQPCRDDVIRLGNLKFAHYGAVSYIKEIAPKCGIKVDEKVFARAWT